MRKFIVPIVLALVVLLNAGSAQASTNYPWRSHAKPFDFLFGNHIDHHQQSLVNRRGQVQGFLYIHFTGEVMDGIPVAEHSDCDMMEGCTVGWLMQGVPVAATLLANEMMMEPQWCINAQAMPPRPGYSHFHWLGEPAMGMDLVVGQQYNGYLLKLIAVDTFYFRHHDSLTLVTPGLDLTSHANVTVGCGN